MGSFKPVVRLRNIQFVTTAGHNPSRQWYDCAFRSESTCVSSSCALRAVGHNQPTEHKSLIVQRLQAVAAALLSIRLCITRCRRKRPHAVAQHVIVPLKAPNHNQARNRYQPTSDPCHRGSSDTKLNLVGRPRCLLHCLHISASVGLSKPATSHLPHARHAR